MSSPRYKSFDLFAFDMLTQPTAPQACHCEDCKDADKARGIYRCPLCFRPERACRERGECGRVGS